MSTQIEEEVKVQPQQVPVVNKDSHTKGLARVLASKEGALLQDQSWEAVSQRLITRDYYGTSDILRIIVLRDENSNQPKDKGTNVVCHANRGHMYGAFAMYLDLEEERIVISKSICSHKDPFNKKTAIRMAVGRLSANILAIDSLTFHQPEEGEGEWVMEIAKIPSGQKKTTILLSIPISSLQAGLKGREGTVASIINSFANNKYTHYVPDTTTWNQIQFCVSKLLQRWERVKEFEASTGE